MIPLRLTFLLIGAILLALVAFGNPEPVQVRFIFWSQQLELYKLILIAVGFGALLAILYTGHVRHVRRSFSERFRR